VRCWKKGTLGTFGPRSATAASARWSEPGGFGVSKLGGREPMMDLQDRNAEIAAVDGDGGATLESLRRRLDDLVTLRASGVWSERDQDQYLRLAKHEADVLRRS
jgi:hypothetical protein